MSDTLDEFNVPEVDIHGNVQGLSGKDTEFPKVDNCPSQLEFGRFGGTEEKSPGTVHPPSGESCGVSVSAKPAGKKAKPAEPTTPAPGGWTPKSGLALKTGTLANSRTTQTSRTGPSLVKKRWKSWRRSRPNPVQDGHTVTKRSYLAEEHAEATTQGTNGQTQKGKCEGNDGSCDKLPQNEAEAEQGTLLRLPSRWHARKEDNDWARD